jgi:hypothetical protein
VLHPNLEESTSKAPPISDPAVSLEALSADQDEKRECQAYRIFQASPQEKGDRRTRERQAHQVERVSHERVPVTQH